MSEENEPKKTAEPTSNNEPSPTSDEPKVPRSLLSQQGAEWKAKNDELAAKLARFEEAERERTEAQLKKAGDFEKIENNYKTKIAELENSRLQLETERKRDALKMHLVSSGLDPADPRDSLTIEGILAKYDGQTEVPDWFGKFKLENAAVFEERPQYRQVSPTGSPASPTAPSSEVENLISRWKKGDLDAAMKLDAMEREGKLSQESKAAMGVV